MHNDKMAAALEWAERGFRVFPLPPNGRVPSSDWVGWPEHATTEPEKIKAWWEGTDQNIGVCATGLLIVDIDVKKGRAGPASWEALGGGPETLTVRTPSGGLHLYYWGADVALSAGALGEGLDIRSHNSYVIAPGSVIDGVPYEVVHDVPMQRAPQHIVARCQPPGVRAENAAVPLADLDTPAAVQAAVERVACAPAAMQGEQSEAAYKLACAVRDHGISEALCNTIMAPWGARCAPPVIGDDLRGRIANAYAYAQNAAGAKHPEMLFGTVNLEPPPSPQEVQTSQAARSGLRLLTMDECASTAPRGYVIKNMIAPGQLGCIFGQPGAGKSVLAPHLAYAVAQGRHVFRQRTTKGAVFYVCAEDEAGMRERVAALRESHGAAPGFHLVAGVSALVTGGDAVAPDLARLLQLVEEHRPSLVVVDTLAASISGLDENSSEGMSKVVHAMRAVRQLGPAVILVHHSPKSGDTPRGHSVLNGDLDVSMIVEPDATAEGVIRGELKKNRNGPCTLDLAFRIDSAARGTDQDGDPITAPVCLERTAAEVREDRAAKLTAAEGRAEAILAGMALERKPANAAPFAPPPPVPIGEWEDRCIELGVLSSAKRVPDRRRMFNQARDGLHKKVRIRIEHGCVAYLGRGFEEGAARLAGRAQFGPVSLPQNGTAPAVAAVELATA